MERQGIEVHWGKRCVSVKEESERGATVLFKGEKEAEAEFVVGEGWHQFPDPAIFGESQFSCLMGVMEGWAKLETNKDEDAERSISRSQVWVAAVGEGTVQDSTIHTHQLAPSFPSHISTHGPLPRDGWE
jgi:hypothetical protein